MHRLLVALTALAALGCASQPETRSTTPARTNDPTDPSTAAPGDDDDDALALSPLYAPLFEEGSVFTFAVEESRQFWDDTHPKADLHGNVNDQSSSIVACRVDSVLDLVEMRVSTIFCEPTSEPTVGTENFYAADLPFSGYWVATHQGLYAIDEPPDLLADAAGQLRHLETLIVDSRFFLPAAPEPLEERTEEDDGAFGSSLRIAKQGAAWCVERIYWGGDEAGLTLCFEPGRGPLSGTQWWVGGSSITLVFERIP